jgi:DNA-binding transcriptional LysR family regulator
MEDRFGRVLFKRGHSGVELTSAGQHFRQYALNIQRLWQQAQQRISLPESFSQGIGLGSQVSLWDSLILKWIPWMRKNAESVAIHVEADYSPSLMRQLSDGLLDIGVMYNPRQTPGLVIEDLLEETLVLVATDRREVREGWVEDYVFVDWGEEFRRRHGEAFPDMDTPAISVGLGSLGLEYILQNGGSGYLVTSHCESCSPTSIPESCSWSRAGPKCCGRPIWSTRRLRATRTRWSWRSVA